jgi:transcriptional regulator with XRE-family HTH domain
VDIRQKFAARLRELRLKRKLTQVNLSAMTEIPQPSISNWEQGKHDPELSAVVKLAEALGVEIGELVRDPDTPFSRPSRGRPPGS